MKKVRQSFFLNEGTTLSSPATNTVAKRNPIVELGENALAVTARDQTASSKAEWNEFMDENTGRSYFVNTVTRESQWTIPGYNSRGTPKSSSADMQNTIWNKFVHETTGHVYFVNVVTGESQWARPIGFFSNEKSAEISSLSPALSSSASSSSSSSSASSSEEEEEEDDDEEDEEDEEEDDDGEDEDEDEDAEKESAAAQDSSSEISRIREMVLRAHTAVIQECLHDGCDCEAAFGRRWDRVAKRCTAHKKPGDVLKLRMSSVEKRGDWEELVDNKTGQTYYYNSDTNESQWDAPLATATLDWASNPIMLANIAANNA